MTRQRLIIFSSVLAIGASNLVGIPSAYAFNMGDMMKPGKWFGDNDRWDDDYYYDRYGPYGPYGYGPYGGGWGGPYGGYGPYGYGYPYGYGAPGYQQQQSSEPPPPPLPQ